MLAISDKILSSYSNVPKINVGIFEELFLAHSIETGLLSDKTKFLT